MIWPIVPYSHRHGGLGPGRCPLPRRPDGDPLAGHRRPGAGRGRAAHLRLSCLGAVRLYVLTIVSAVVGVSAGAVQGLFRRLGGPDLSAFHRDLVGPADPLPADHPGQRRGAQFLVAPGPDADVFLDGVRRRGAGRVPESPQLRLRARGPCTGGRATSPSCSAISCPTPWWSPPPPSCRSPLPARSPC